MINKWGIDDDRFWESMENVIFSPDMLCNVFRLRLVRVDPTDDTDCALCLSVLRKERLTYKCERCSIHFHHSCLNSYTKSYDHNCCMQCKKQF